MDERSPLFGSTPDSLAYSEAEIIAVFDGTDEVNNSLALPAEPIQVLLFCKTKGLFGSAASKMVLHSKR